MGLMVARIFLQEPTMDGVSTRKRATERAVIVPAEAVTPAKPKTRVFVLVQKRVLGNALIRVFRRRNLEVVGYGSQEQATAEEITNSGCDVLLLDFFDRQWVSLFNDDVQNAGKAVKIVVIGM